jgi:hypothetical protein
LDANAVNPDAVAEVIPAAAYEIDALGKLTNLRGRIRINSDPD